MIDDDDEHYQLDAHGVRVLIGLSAAETAEFIRLDSALGDVRMTPMEDGHTWSCMEDRRWLELFEKHEAARQPFRNASRTRH
ncbi:hypothetical protein RPMA_15005 [Tardiphaga alba]|uniref:Uncharacterized protein n=1 Tax=Tardiphaga alba TaxID=340268 RepID=A0ABX8A933_9BRAD|nr:hypothetical protein [Tardiphaga alba]QUS39992.1 hypothetical protein RPMA_15005 [Tardiphaga alba]